MKSYPAAVMNNIISDVSYVFTMLRGSSQCKLKMIPRGCCMRRIGFQMLAKTCFDKKIQTSFLSKTCLKNLFEFLKKNELVQNQ